MLEDFVSKNGRENPRSQMLRVRLLRRYYKEQQATVLYRQRARLYLFFQTALVFEVGCLNVLHQPFLRELDDTSVCRRALLKLRDEFVV